MSASLMAAALITVEVILCCLRVPKVTASSATITTTSAAKGNVHRHQQQTDHGDSFYSAALHSLLGVDLPDEFEVVYPYFTDEKGRFVTSLSDENENVTHSRRRRRSTGRGKVPSPRLFIGIEHQNEKLVLKLRPNKKFLAPRATVERLLSNSQLEEETLHSDCYYVGRLKHQRHSIAAVDVCNGLTGFIQAKERAYFITPLHGVRAQKTRSAHLLYPVNASRPISLANDYWKDDDIVANKTVVERNIRSAITSNDVSDTTSPKLKEKYMAVSVAADQSVVEFHGDKIEQFILILMNIVNAIYSDSSLGAKLSIIVTRIVLLTEEEESKITEGNSRESLENVCYWFKELNKNHSGYRKHDIGIYLTRLDIGGPAGYAPVGGMCNPRRSCSLNRDEGLTSAFVIAHEIGHVLGFSHDGDEDERNTCSQDGAEGSIMAPLVLATFTRYHWSKCTVNEYRNKINKWFCLNDKPAPFTSKVSFQQPLGSQYSLDDQCRMEFGEGFSLCRSFMLSDPCTHLWCSNRSTPLMCKTKKGPPLEGTPCGKGKWCASGFCQLIDKSRISKDSIKKNPQHGNWGEWSPYGDCSRSCGGGVRFRTRRCDNPKPDYRGEYCQGNNEEFIICNKQMCPLARDFRAEQCATLPGVRRTSQRRSKVEWVPYPVTNDSMFCKLTCVSKRTQEVFISEENVIDGTLCSYDIPHHMCVQGQCQRVGCDKVLGSTKADDLCGTCGGNNSDCKNSHKIFVRTPTKPNTRVTVLPRGARNIHVREVTPTPSNLVLHRRRTKEFFPTGKFEQEFVNRSFICEGTRFVYVRTNVSESLTAKGPLLDELVVMLYSPDPSPKVSSTIVVDFTVSLKKDPYERLYVWDVLSWSPCSRTCGGGDQLTKVVCRDRRSDKVVSKRFCSILEKPSIKRRPCNTFSCSYRWRTGPWEHCTHTCGSRGFQHRQLFCIPMNESSTFVDPNFCTDTRPEERRACNRKPCPSQWVVGSWSQCSVTCGTGIQTRNITCLTPENETHFECGEKPEQFRECFQKPCKAGVCTDDISEFCQLKVLQRYCAVPDYKERCCHSCSNYVSEV